VQAGTIECGDLALPMSVLFVPRTSCDFDSDGDVDRDDFVLFQRCFSGPDVNAAVGCGSQDLDGDHDVDQSDFGILQRCFSGQGVRPSPGCDR